MGENELIETIGSITKKEHLCSVKSEIMENTLVLNNVNPFPGIRTSSPGNNIKLSSYFIILRYRYAPEKINRINFKLFKNKALERYPSYGEIITLETVLPCIRLKEVKKTELASIQEYLKYNDLQLKVYKDFDQISRIKIFKTFKLTSIGDGIYRDLKEGEKFYINYNGTINWKRFDFIVKNIRFNLNNPNFDAALGVIYRFCGPENVIRIYDYDKSLQRALLLRKLFLAEIKNEFQKRATQFNT